MNGYAALAHNRTVLGEGEETEGLVSSIFSAAGSGVSNILKMKRDKEAAQKSTADSTAALQAAIQADQRAKDALAKAMVSEALKSPSASADRLAADMALQAEDTAAAGLSPENQKKRAEAARSAVERATAEWQAASAGKDTGATTVKEMWVRAAQQILARVQNSLIVQSAQLPGGVVQMQQVQPQGWLTRKTGPLPNWGWLGGIAAIAGTVAIALKRRA